MIEKELVDSNFDFGFMANTYNNTIMGIKVYQNFIMNNKDFFSYDKGKCFLSHILSYSIERSFYNFAYEANSKYSVNIGKVNEYGFNGLYIRTSDFILNIAKTDRSYKLPSKAKYKLELAKNNIGMDAQLKFDKFGNYQIDDYKYAFITYGYNNGELKHLRIIIPDSTYSSILYDKNLLKNINMYENIISEKTKTEQIAHLKKELQKKYI